MLDPQDTHVGTEPYVIDGWPEVTVWTDQPSDWRWRLGGILLACCTSLPVLAAVGYRLWWGVWPW